MKLRFQSSVFVIVVAIVMVGASHPCYADLGDQLAKLLPDDGATADWFGYSVSISGTTAIIGAWRHGDNGFQSGSAYLFDSTTGEQLFKLLPDDGAARDFFGRSVAISGAIAVVGALSNDDNGTDSGSAYLFNTTTGEQLFKLLPDDGAAGDGFGFSVGISGATAIVGAPGDDDNGTQSGSAYLFDISDPANPTQLFKLLPDDGARGEQFGFSIAISGATAIVGAKLDDDNGRNSGSAYLFDTTTGAQLFKLLPDDGAANDFFGWSIAISGTTAIVGAPEDDDNGSASGSAYLFDTTTGQQLFKLLPDDGAAAHFFGRSVAISGTTAIVGAPQDDDNGGASGSAYLFDTATGQQIAKLLANDGAVLDLFGYSVAISGATAIVGAIWDDDNGDRSGSAYLFDAASGTPAVLTDFTMIDGFIVAGGLPEIDSSDNTYLETEALVTGERAETHRMRMRVGAMTAVQNPTTIDITLEAHITDIEAIVTLFLRNFGTGNFEEVGQFTNGLGVDTTNTVNVPNASRFVRPNGRIVLRVKKIVILPFTLNGFHSLDDLLEIRVR